MKQTGKHIYRLGFVASTQKTAQTTRLPRLSCRVGQVLISSPWRDGEDAIATFRFPSIRQAAASIRVFADSNMQPNNARPLSYGRLKGAEATEQETSTSNR